MPLVAFPAFADRCRKERRPMPRGRRSNPPRPARFTVKGQQWYPNYASQLAFIVGESRDGSFWRVKLEKLKTVMLFTKTAVELCGARETSEITHHRPWQPTKDQTDQQDPRDEHRQPQS